MNNENINLLDPKEIKLLDNMVEYAKAKNFTPYETYIYFYTSIAENIVKVNKDKLYKVNISTILKYLCDKNNNINLQCEVLHLDCKNSDHYMNFLHNGNLVQINDNSYKVNNGIYFADLFLDKNNKSKALHQQYMLVPFEDLLSQKKPVQFSNKEFDAQLKKFHKNVNVDMKNKYHDSNTNIEDIDFVDLMVCENKYSKLIPFNEYSKALINVTKNIFNKTNCETIELMKKPINEMLEDLDNQFYLSTCTSGNNKYARKFINDKKMQAWKEYDSYVYNDAEEQEKNK